VVALGRSYLIATIAFLYLPIVVLVAMAFNTSALYALPIEPSLRWFAVLADNGPLLAATRNSLERSQPWRSTAGNSAGGPCSGSSSCRRSPYLG